jgi:hypothetical protein
MTYSLICYEVRSKNARQKGIARRGNQDRKPYWFHSDGTPFPPNCIDIDWSTSTLADLNEKGSRFIDQLGIWKHDHIMMMQIAAPRFQEIIGGLRSAISGLEPEKEIDKERGMHFVTIHNVITTFDIMVKKFDDRAFFCIH